MNDRKVAIVTGSNKGIGYAIVKGLCEKFSGDVYLTARDKNRGLEAIRCLNKLGYHPRFHCLDVTDYDSIVKLRFHLQERYGGVDVLVNNAAIAHSHLSEVPFHIQAQETLSVNYFGLKNVSNMLFPLLRSHSRAVNLSSFQAALKNIPGDYLREKLASDDLTEPELTELMNNFVKAAHRGTHEEEGWPNDAYTVSKVAVNVLTGIYQRDFLMDETREDIVINAVHPGHIATDMTHYKGYLNTTQGAEIPLYAALLPKNVIQPVGAFIWWNKQIIDWVSGPIPSI